ncbi:exported hypothetical protein [Nostocoides australiense Ben110]|uniref:L,D-TPase catalytic domain-containing protein n=1 Tax=Nostocoides australiense Ben110 TaxID=1193182 RepID=W6K0K9_9MICO|nr:L,D-transpeptidase family protein [Tetrasphaera australiensis]CCH75408.1 exported hypothetical protein [Tetrasphaera australiensis Ben110]
MNMQIARRATVVAMAAGLGITAAAPAFAETTVPAPKELANAAVGPTVPVPQEARRGESDPVVKRAQQIMAKFGIPAGPADGITGQQTRQGLCAFRRISGLPVNRYSLNTETYRKLVEYDNKYSRLNQIGVSSFQGKSTFVHVQQACQTMFYVKDKKVQRVLPVSTGVRGHETPFGYYTLANTTRGWYCSTLYPESCRKQTTGEFAYISNFGNMYNPRQVVGAIFVHGSTSVPTYPASHGCIRVTVNDSDWLYHNVDRMPIFITGKY